LHAIVAGFTNGFDQIQPHVYFTEQKLGLAGARNRGSKLAKGEIVAFVDDDVLLAPDWAQEMVRCYSDPDVIGVTGAAVPLWNEKGLDWLPKPLYWLISCSVWANWDSVVEVRSLWGYSMSLRRKALEMAGSFLSVESITGYHAVLAEDLELSVRAKKVTGGKLLFNPALVVQHKVYSYRLSLKFASARAHHIGVSRRVLGQTYIREYFPMTLERKAGSGIAGILLGLPALFIRHPSAACKTFILTIVILLSAAFGYMLPGKALQAVNDIENALKDAPAYKASGGGNILTISNDAQVMK
jgi:glycosyltransferase involved in cell wall biosynthesis